ncbi:hypothetical protein [Pedobacter gandavensis]|uniref:hypothetical protein n=1 Tax=Pedobacter gandavensis TaxID=2679963 RepID=UPI0029306AC3|nr:hypothetical protein [Pedobacter gandavensis]
MKKNILYLVFIGFILGQFLISCKRQELAEPAIKKIISLQITGTTLPGDTLEFVKNGKVLLQTGFASFALSTKVSLEGESAEVQIRRKRDQLVIARKTIIAEAYNQVLTCYYDGQEVYDTLVDLEIKGYSGPDELEFMLDGVLVGSGTGTTFPSLKVTINKEKKRQVQIRKKGDPKILLDYEVLGNVALQKLVFYYDGVQLLDKIELGAPQNPANMLFSASFKSSVTVFSGPVDLVFCKGSIYENFENLPVTSHRIELNNDGSFSKNFELPALTAQDIADKLHYGIRLVKRGTLIDIPYDLTNELRPIYPRSGVHTGEITVSPGTAMLMVFKDSKSVYATGPASRRGTLFSLLGVDISAYFKP